MLKLLRNNILKIIALLILSGAFCACTTKQENYTVDIKTYKKGIDLINKDTEIKSITSLGKGLILENGNIMTVAHLIRGAQEISVNNQKAKLVKLMENDLAILKTTNQKKGLKISQKACKQYYFKGTKVGKGQQKGIFVSLVSGIGSDKQLEIEGLNFSNTLEFDLNAAKGDSGTPLLCENGKVAGVLVGVR